VDAGSILGVPAVRTSLLDDLSSAGAAQTKARCGADAMTADVRNHDYSESPARFADDEDELDDDLDDEFGDEDDDEDDEDDDENGEDPETWQVCSAGSSTPKAVGTSLDFHSGKCLDLRPLSSSSELDPFGGLRVCLPAQSLGS
jgi:hypothetical protein